MEIKGKKGKASMYVTEDEEYKKINYEKFASLPTGQQLSDLKGSSFRVSTSVVGPNTLYSDPGPEMCSNLDPDPFIQKHY